jgi:negative regulator of flagellin synthesis FlgM
VSSKIGGVDGNSPSTAIGAGRAVQRPQDAATGEPKNSNGSGGSSVQITGTARQMASLEQAVRDLPAVNDTKVAQISAAIEQGTYKVDARDIANKLVQLEKALVHGSRGREDVANGSGSGTDAESELDAY